LGAAFGGMSFIVCLLVFLAGLWPLPPVREQGVKWVLIEVVLIKVGVYYLLAFSGLVWLNGVYG
jgi:hypothetical protein